MSVDSIRKTCLIEPARDKKITSRSSNLKRPPTPWQSTKPSRLSLSNPGNNPRVCAHRLHNGERCSPKRPPDPTGPSPLPNPYTISCLVSPHRTCQNHILCPSAPSPCVLGDGRTDSVLSQP
ncbi:hypothetical protein BGZ61DRAFT_73983 [Ilyonectria robusta]|uniref:uncharacterized protein n=1 Tax=Ilyonectria robusta TaxID=1079257 RepID=UPI001E8D30B0|nr:uncharacterized protein BGZ61DRAFT_73983 [Ilyonectria robusta]KAH8677051.1 hypothetical protein BGZ61DRAFT_73983 [Ilyonectria robusta]